MLSKKYLLVVCTAACVDGTVTKTGVDTTGMGATAILDSLVTELIIGIIIIGIISNARANRGIGSSPKSDPVPNPEPSTNEVSDRKKKKHMIIS